jgi:endonuclease YncB( thermonuclease family)
LSRRRIRRAKAGWLTVLALVAIVSVVAGLPYAVASKDARRPESEPVLTSLTLPAGVTLASLEKGRVEKIVDGDTIDIRLDGRLVRLRYYGVDTPERGSRCFREATDRNETLVGKEVLLLPDARDQDRFGRLLRYVFLADGTSVDATLVAEGFGLAWPEDGRYRPEITQLQSEAEQADRGCLWK